MNKMINFNREKDSDKKKVIDTLFSCKTPEQFEIAKNMSDYYEQKWKDKITVVEAVEYYKRKNEWHPFLSASLE